jgi:hypothetical protein
LFDRSDHVVLVDIDVAIKTRDELFEQGGELRDLEVLQSFEVNDPFHPDRVKVTAMRRST